MVAQRKRRAKLRRIDYADVSPQAAAIIDGLGTSGTGGDLSSILNEIVVEWPAFRNKIALSIDSPQPVVDGDRHGLDGRVNGRMGSTGFAAGADVIKQGNQEIKKSRSQEVKKLTPEVVMVKYASAMGVPTCM